jgi:hypothetical protein
MNKLILDNRRSGPLTNAGDISSFDLMWALYGIAHAIANCAEEAEEDNTFASPGQHALIGLGAAAKFVVGELIDRMQSAERGGAT